MTEFPPTFVPALRDVTLPDGSRLLAGLNWEREPQFSLPVIGQPGMELRHARHRAQLPTDMEAEGARSLLIAMANELAKAPAIDALDGVWMLLADVSGADGPGYWLAMAELMPGPNGLTHRPLFGPEDVFAEVDDLCHAVKGIASTMPLAGLAMAQGRADITSKLRARIRSIIDELALGDDNAIPIERVTLPDPDPLDPVFAPQPSVGGRGLAFGGLLVGSLVLAATLLPVLIVGAQRPESVVETPMVRVAPAAGSFATRCTDTLQGWWPRIVGWRIETEGCALDGFVPDGTVPRSDLNATRPEGGRDLQMVVWKRYAPSGQINTVLANRAAEQVLSDWTHGERRLGGDILLWQLRSVPLAQVVEPENPVESNRPLAAQVEALWADEPGSVRPIPDGVSVRAPARADRIFARLETVPELSPIRLQSDTGMVTLDLRTDFTRLVPTTLFDPKGARP